MSVTEYVCRIDELADPGTRAFTLSDTVGEERLGIIVRAKGRVYAYRDSCPHTGVSLAWIPGRYLDVDGAFLQCATHGALFMLETGLCVQGPCMGQSLVPLETFIDGGRVFVVIPST